MNTQNKGLIYASITALLWGFLAIAQKVMLKSLDAYTIVWSRFLIAFVVLSIYIYRKNKNELKILIRPPWLIIVGAISLLINYVSVLKGLDYTSPNTVQIIIQSAPIMFCLTGIFFFKEKATNIQKIGFALSAVGLLIFYSSQLEAFVHDVESFNIGFILIMIGAIGWVIYAVVQKLMVRKYDPQTLNLVLYGLPIIILFYFVDFDRLLGLSIGEYALLLFLGLNTLIAYGAMSEALKYAEASKVSVIITMNPIITVVSMSVLAYLEVTWIKGEIMSLKSLIGALILIVGGIVVSKYKK
jgi:drug/metabolite transporter (DMT)-like permease